MFLELNQKTQSKENDMKAPKVIIKTIPNAKPLTNSQKEYWSQRLNSIIAAKKEELTVEYTDIINKKTIKKAEDYKKFLEINKIFNKINSLLKVEKETKAKYDNELRLITKNLDIAVTDLVHTLQKNNFYRNNDKDITKFNEEQQYGGSIWEHSTSVDQFYNINRFIEMTSDKQVREELSKNNVNLKQLDDALLQIHDALQMQNVPSSFFNLVKHLFVTNNITAEGILNNDLEPMPKISKH
jgi:Txe/YoeB family toxin of Txe-Axe toxin-antitoxin module